MEKKAEEIKIDLADFRVGVDNVIFSVDINKNKLLVLLIEEKQSSSIQSWSLPSTLVQQGESLEEAAQRILAEKIKVENLYLEQLYTFGGVDRQWQESPKNIAKCYLSVSYFALVRYEEAEITKDIKRANWVTLDSLPTLTFDHDRIVEYGHRRLKSKVEKPVKELEGLPPCINSMPTPSLPLKINL